MYQGCGATQAVINGWDAIHENSGANLVPLSGNGEMLLAENAQLVIDQYPQHGTISELATMGLPTLSYTPDPGYRGLDIFYYHWSYNEINYWPPYNVIGRTTTNVAREEIQVAPWVDLVPQETYADHATMLLGVGQTETATLTLQNPRGDGVPTAERWYLDFNPDVIQVSMNGQQIEPGGFAYGEFSGSVFTNIVGTTRQFTLTITSVGGGEDTLSAISYAWSGPLDHVPITDTVLDAGWHFSTEQDVTVNVPTLDIERNDVKITNKTTTVIVGQHMVLNAVFNNGGLALTPLEYDWEIPGDPIATYTQTVPKGWTGPLIDTGSQEISYYWTNGGSGLVVNVGLTVRGQPSYFDAQATFNVLRPAATLTASTTTDQPPVNVSDIGDGLELHFGSFNSSPGITWNGTVTANPGSARPNRVHTTGDNRHP